MSEQELEVKETPTSIEEIQAASPVQTGVIAFPHAQDSNKQATLQFRKGVLQMLKQAVEGGINKTIVEVSAVREELVSETETELLDLGYKVTYANQVKASKGYTSRQMIISY